VETGDSSESPLAISDPSAIAGLREVLADAGYRGETLRDALGEERPGGRPGEERPVQRRRLAGGGALGTIAALFTVGDPVAAADVRRAFGPISPERLEALGLVELSGDLVRPRVRLVPHNDLLIASDLLETGSSRTADHVAGVQGPSVTLSHLTVRRRVDDALDVGAGCGFQALLAAGHAGRVVASDVNERALNFAAFNALLNGLSNIEVRAGSLFEPAGGDRFDLVVCNPPYVISPETAYLVRDSGLGGDTVSREVVRQASAALDEGAFGSMLVSWVHHPGEEWAVRPRSWLEGNGCDAVLLHYGTQDPLTHAASWAREPSGGDEPAFEAMLDRWLAYLEDEGIDGIAYGAVVLRRRSGATNWVAEHTLPSGGLRPAEAQLLRIFAANDLLARLPDERGLLDVRFALAAAAVVEQQVVLRDGGWVSDAIEIRLDEGLQSRVRVDPPIAHLLASLDGERTLADVVERLSVEQDADAAETAAHAVPVVRRLFELGLVTANDSA
jgi:methylase of polypeptide subunit release factors